MAEPTMTTTTRLEPLAPGQWSERTRNLLGGSVEPVAGLEGKPLHGKGRPHLQHHAALADAQGVRSPERKGTGGGDRKDRKALAERGAEGALLERPQASIACASSLRVEQDRYVRIALAHDAADTLHVCRRLRAFYHHVSRRQERLAEDGDADEQLLHDEAHR